MKEPVMFSTDIGSDIDDALTLLIMLNHPSINLQGVYTVNGNVNARCYIAKRMVDLAGRNIPVGRGVSKPLGALVEPYFFFEDYLIDEMYFDEERMEAEMGREAYYKPLKKIGVFTDGVGHMAEQLLKQPQVVFNTAPLTNIAILLRKYPEAAANITKLYVMGFRMNGDLEHNVRYDPVSAQEVLNSNIPLVIVPSDLCSRYRMKASDSYDMRSPVGQYVSSQLKAFVGATIISACRQSGCLLDFLERSQMAPSALARIGGEEYLNLDKFKSVFLANFDEYTAYLERDKFLDDFQKLIELLEDERCGYDDGSILVGELRRIAELYVSVADTYVPYCFLHPEKIKTERRTFACDYPGGTFFLDGDKHEVVTDLDFEHFAGFLREYLR